MPIGRKITVKNDCKLDAFGFLSGSEEVLKKTGLLVGKQLILDAGLKIRIDGFSGTVGAKSWPITKISVFQPESKMAQCYVSFNSFDGITWEADEDDEPKPKREVQRLNLSFEGYMHSNDVDGYPCWHRSFKEGFKIWEKDKMINPLELSEEEILKGIFHSTIEFDFGEATIKKGSSSFVYVLRFKRFFTFEISKFPGVMRANLKDFRDTIEMYDRWNRNDIIKSFEYTLPKQDRNIDDLKKTISSFLKEKHQLQ